MITRTVRVASLGLCEHCGALVSIEDLPVDAMDADWRCFACNGLLTHLSFGYDQGAQGAHKEKWVGPSGQWVDERPAEDFHLGSMLVVTSLPLRPVW